MKRARLVGAFVMGCVGCSGSGASVSNVGGGGPDASVAETQCADGGAAGCLASGQIAIPLGGENAFPPGDDGSGGASQSGNKLTIDLGATTSTLPPLIWIANSDEGTISKVDTRTMKEQARYRTGPVTGPTTPDPSRTTVGLSGDVVVANRGGASATRIASDVSRCVDRNNNGRIDTSTGPTDVRPWGADECVLWNTPFPPGSLGRAAAFDAQTDADGRDISTVWIGLYTLQQMLQLDPADGHVLTTLDVAPVMPYGAAIDHSENVWVWGNGSVARIDPQHNVTHIPDPPCGYGIAVDATGRVWVGGQTCVARYTPSTGQWQSVTVGQQNRGIALDGRGSVWIADTDFGVHRLDEETMAIKKDLFLQWQTFVGIAIDVDHKVWAISRGSSAAVRINPDDYSFDSIKTGSGPYTYSDMTGFQLRNAAPQSGTWRHTFAGCRQPTHFMRIGFEAKTPVATAIQLSARTAASPDALASAQWTIIGNVPGANSPIDLDGALGAGATANYLEVEALLRTADPGKSPELDKLTVAMDCLAPIQ